MIAKSAFTNGILVASLAALSALGCGDDLGASTGSQCPEGSTLTYANFGERFMQDNCTACHGANGPESPALASLTQIRAHLDEIDRAAAAGPNGVNTFMPEGGSIAESERRKLGEWLACDAPE
jgi:mono/diheme cytochrome c family protein